MSKKLDLDNIQPLPKHLRKQVYGDDYNDTWKLRYSGLSDSEKRTLNTFLKYQEAKEIYWIPEVDYPQRKHSPDLLIDGVKVEIKEVTSKRSIEYQIRSAHRQVDTSGIILIDSTNSSLSSEEIVNEVAKRAKMKDVKAFFIAGKNNQCAYGIKKGDSVTAEYAFHDPKSPYVSILPNPGKKVKQILYNTKKTIHPPQTTGARDHESSYVSILPNPGQKVKPRNELFSNKDGAAELSAPLKPRKRTNAYWQRRVEHTYLESEKAADAYRKRVSRVYADAQKTCLVELKQLYEDCWSKQAGFDRAKLRQVVNAKTMADFRRKLIEANLQNSLPPEYSGRVTRLQLLDAQLWYAAHKAGLDQTDIVTASSAKTYEDAYYKTAYNIATGTGLMPTFTTLDTDAINAVLSEKFSGKSYSERIWTNSDLLAKQLSTKLASAIATGQSIDKTAKDFRDRFGVSRYYAERLIRTETNHFYNQAANDSYKAMGIDKYKFIATLDSRTSEICAHMDGKIIEVDEGAVGVNIPPLHPNCRSTIAPYLGKDLDALANARAYHDPDTDKTEYCDNMTYDEWRKWVDSDADEPRQVPNNINNKITAATGNQAQASIEPQGGTLTLNELKRRYKSRGIDHVDYNPVKPLDKELTEKEIIERVSGHDDTKGSCASLAMAYAANKLGLDVLDFRDGVSRTLFSNKVFRRRALREIGINVITDEDSNSVASGKRLLSKVETGKEYILGVGMHASIVRRREGVGLQYLELQSGVFPGWQQLNVSELRRRFKCKNKDNALFGTLVDLNEFKDNNEFRELMGYINTNYDNQNKRSVYYAKK